MKPAWRILLALLAYRGLTIAHAGPWLAPGDEGLRSDIQLLADSGIVHGPITSWPISWPDVARDVLANDLLERPGDAGLDTSTVAALSRVQRRARVEASRGFSGARARLSAATEPVRLRHFAVEPREKGEVEIGASWLGTHAAINLQGVVVADPDDGKTFRPDGSYLGLNAGNVMVSVGYMERWWGPGWDGSLILSSNARPIPSLTVERNYTDPFESRWLSWIGPWRASISLGQAEKHKIAVPNVRFFSARINFKPRPWLEFALSRTAQWCGGKSDCDWQTFGNMLLGRDNQVQNGQVTEQPGNQLAGYDLRLRSPWKALPLVLYTQWIGEDEAGSMPSKFLGLFGVESWASTPLGGLRLSLEYADTTCTFTRQRPDFNCAYRNERYPQGYAYRGRIIGDSIDNDSRRYSLTAILTRPGGSVFSLNLRHAELNRDGTGSHVINEAPGDLDNVELRLSRGVGFGVVNVGVAFDDAADHSNSGLRGFVSWQQGF